MSPIYGQPSDKPPLASLQSHGVWDMKHKRDEKLNGKHLLADRRRAIGLPPTLQLGFDPLVIGPEDFASARGPGGFAQADVTRKSGYVR